MDEVERAMLEQRILQLKIEHRDLDDVIKRLADHTVYDQVQLQRLKRRKLLLKDQIAWLERQVDPDRAERLREGLEPLPGRRIQALDQQPLAGEAEIGRAHV